MALSVASKGFATVEVVTICKCEFQQKKKKKLEFKGLLATYILNKPCKNQFKTINVQNKAVCDT